MPLAPNSSRQSSVDGRSFSKGEAGESRRRHADRLQGDRRDCHSVARRARHELRHIGAARRKIDADANAKQELREQDEARVRRDCADKAREGDDRHVGDEDALAAESVRADAAESRPRDRAEHQRRSNQADEKRADRKVALEQRQRDAQSGYREAVQKGAAARCEPIGVMTPCHRRFVERRKNRGGVRRRRRHRALLRSSSFFAC